MGDETWSETTPALPGWYWLYGWPWGITQRPARKYAILVERGMFGLCYYTHGDIIRDLNDVVGIWTGIEETPVDFKKLLAVQAKATGDENA